MLRCTIPIFLLLAVACADADPHVEGEGEGEGESDDDDVCDLACDPRVDDDCVLPICTSPGSGGGECTIDGVVVVDALPDCWPCVQSQRGLGSDPDPVLLCRDDVDPTRFVVVGEERCLEIGLSFDRSALDRSVATSGIATVLDDDGTTIRLQLDDRDGTIVALAPTLATGTTRTPQVVGNALAFAFDTFPKSNHLDRWTFRDELGVVFMLGNPLAGRVDGSLDDVLDVDVAAVVGQRCVVEDATSDPGACCTTRRDVTLTLDGTICAVPFSGVIDLAIDDEVTTMSATCVGHELTCSATSADCGGFDVQCAFVAL